MRPPTFEAATADNASLPSPRAGAALILGLVCLLAFPAWAAAAGGRAAARDYMIVSFGDSYTAGTGAGNEYGDARCHRSYDSYPWRFRENLRLHYGYTANNWHVACHGAVVGHLPGQVAQLQQAPTNTLLNADVVLLTIGGNDVQFSALVEWCIYKWLSSDCATLMQSARATLPSVVADTKTQLLWISRQTNAHIILLGYPRLTSPGCLTPHNGNFRSFQDSADDAQAAMIAALNQQNNTNRFHFFSLASTFDGHGPCAVTGRWIWQLHTDSWSFHPQKEGHQAIADLLLNQGVHSWSRPTGGGGPPAPPPASNTSSVTLAQGPAAPAGFWYAVTLRGFPPNANQLVSCHDTADPGGFKTFPVRTDGAGAASAGVGGCFSGDGPDHWVRVNGAYESNRVRWGRGGPPPPPSGLAAPTGLRVSDVRETDFWLHWNPVPGADGYTLYLDGNRLLEVPLGMTSFPIVPDGATCNQPHTAGVQANQSTDDGVRVSAIAVINVTLAPCPATPPGAPTGITFTNVKADRFDLAWNAVPGAVGYILYLNGIRLFPVGGATTSFPNFVVGGSCGTRWNVGIQAERGDGSLSAIAERAVTTTACPPPAEDKTPPALRAVSLSTTHVDVTAGPAVVTLNATITDDGSGVAGGSFTVSGPEHGYRIDFSPADLSTNSWRGDIRILQGAAPGAWTLTKVDLRDKAGNTVELTSWLVENALNPSFTVSSPQRQDFTIHLPPGATLQRGTRSPTMWITVRVIGGITGIINLSSRARPGFDVVIGPPTSVNGYDCEQNGGECRVPFYFDVAADMEPRLYAFEIVGTRGSLERTEYIDVLVTE